MAIAAQNLRAGTLFSQDGNIYTVLSYHHHKMGRGKAVIRVKVKDIATGGVREFTFNNSSSVDEVASIKKNLEFVYTDQRKREVIFSDPQTKKRIVLSVDLVREDQLLYLAQGSKVQALINEAVEEVMAIELPMTVDLEIVETGPADRGDTQGAARKPATLNTGLTVQVPMFLKIGDRIRVNTQTGEYKERLS